MARGPFASVNYGCREGGKGLLGLVMKTRDKENGSTESCLDPHIPFPVIRVPITCTACRRWLRTKVDAFLK